MIHNLLVSFQSEGKTYADKMLHKEVWSTSSCSVAFLCNNIITEHHEADEKCKEIEGPHAKGYQGIEEA